MGFDMSKILNYVFIGVGLILAVIISPLVSGAGENMYASVRAHCNLNGDRFLDVLNISGGDTPTTVRIPLKGGSGTPSRCVVSGDIASVYEANATGTGNSASPTLLAGVTSGDKLNVRTPQSDTNNVVITSSANTKWDGAALTPNLSEWHPRPVIGRSLEGAHDIVVAILTPAVAISIIGGMGVSVWMNMSGQSSQSMMARFGQQLAAVIGVVIVGVISPLIINFAGDWAVSVQQLTSAQLLAPVYGVLFDMIPLMLAFVMVALASLPAWGGIAGRGARMLQERYAM